MDFMGTPPLKYPGGQYSPRILPGKAAAGEGGNLGPTPVARRDEEAGVPNWTPKSGDHGVGPLQGS